MPDPFVVGLVALAVLAVILEKRSQDQRRRDEAFAEQLHEELERRRL